MMQLHSPISHRLHFQLKSSAMPTPMLEKVRYLFTAIITSRTEVTDIAVRDIQSMPNRAVESIHFMQGILHNRDVGSEI